MKTVTLIRHAKSSWEFNVIDHERPLNKRGFNDAKLMSNYVKDKITLPNLIISSDAFRAKTTAHFFIEAFNLDNSLFKLEHKLYDFAGRDLVEVIKNCDNTIENLMLFGHNHAATYFVNAFGSQMIDNVPTCGCVTIEFDIDKWEDLKKGETKLVIFPKDLK